MALRRVERRVQNATGIQTHVLPHGEMLETIARSLGHPSGLDLEKARQADRDRFASLARKPLGQREPRRVRRAGVELGPRAQAHFEAKSGQN